MIGVPVGFVGAAESKDALARDARLEYLVVRGRRGGSAMAAAAVNALASGGRVSARPRSTASAWGPGDPELVTVKARRLIESADVVAYPVAKGRGVARGDGGAVPARGPGRAAR